MSRIRWSAVDEERRDRGPARRMTGAARVLVVVYGILALAATGRSIFQLVSKFDEAPVAYSLSVVAGVVYLVATIALAVGTPAWRRVAWVAVGFEMVGVLVVGALSAFLPELFPDDSVWSWFGYGYLFIPLVLPIVGLGYLWRSRARGALG